MRTEVLSFANARGPLEGIYTTPEGTTRAVVVFVSGSGPTTRDGVSVHERIEGVRPPFVVWAEILANHGYASFRYDKRAAIYAEVHSTCAGLADEYGDDLADAVAMLRLMNRLDGPSLVLLGHSLGAIAVLEYVASSPAVHGVVTIGAPIEDIATALKRQLAGTLPEPSYRTLVDSLGDVLAGRSDELVLGVSAAYWRDYGHHTLERLLYRCRPDLPILLLHGTDDSKVPCAQFLDLETRFRRHTNWRWETVPNGDHYLMVQTLRGPGDDGLYGLAPLIEWLDEIA